MFQTLHALPGGQVQGELRVPGDKSISHRAIILGSLSKGLTRISGFLEGADALATANVFRAMGVEIEAPGGGEVLVNGVGLHGLRAPAGPLECGNSGTSMRLLSGLLAAQSFESRLVGDASLSRRPMRRVIDPLERMGARIESEDGRPPLRVYPVNGLRAADIRMTVASAQVKSALILAGLHADGTTRVTEPAPTRDHTERMLAAFGVTVGREGSTVSVAGGQALTGCRIDVPSDISSAAFFLVAASICPGADLTLRHVGMNPTRTGVLQILRAMGADITESGQATVGGEPVADLRVRHAPLKAIEVPHDLAPSMIDEYPALFVAAAFADGRTVARGADELRVKESDRIAAMVAALQPNGVALEEFEDGLAITGTGGELIPGGAPVASKLDHRIAMSMAVAGLGAKAEVSIDDVAPVATSYPGFFSTLDALTGRTRA
jgi:3-phosphoshikimate 1-carboxyvinyltransferase